MFFIREVYESWCASKHLCAQEKQELKGLSPEEIDERFHQHLEFGTAGMRAIMGMGTNRINRYTIRRATKGLASFLLHEITEGAERGVAIAYDTRANSKMFARETGDILSKMGIKVLLFDSVSPVPLLSFAVRKLGCAAGVVITASHNPKEYNGYKVYDEHGCQMTPESAEVLIEYVNRVEDSFSMPQGIATKEIQWIGEEIKNDFINTILNMSRLRDGSRKDRLKVVYTPIHGAGSPLVETLLEKDGFSNVHVIKEQMIVDGMFSTVEQPNPEDKAALAMAIKQAEAEDADIVIGTDPDGDRIGTAVKHQGTYQCITGNQMGALLTEFLTDLNPRKQSQALIKTVVTSELGAAIAKRKGLKVLDTLTGFKYIGHYIDQIEDFLLGYEESYGYLAGTHARDKDAISTAMLICEMAAFYQSKQKTLIDVLHQLYKEYGYYLEAQDSFTFESVEGVNRMEAIMENFRGKGCDLFEDIAEVQDFSKKVKAFPTENMIKYVLKDGSWVAVRPSGTEPKIKMYYSVWAKDRQNAEKRMDALQRAAREHIEV